MTFREEEDMKKIVFLTDFSLGDCRMADAWNFCIPAWNESAFEGVSDEQKPVMPEFPPALSLPAIFGMGHGSFLRGTIGHGFGFGRNSLADVTHRHELRCSRMTNLLLQA